MLPNLPLFPERASTSAGQVDALFFFALGIALFFSLLIAGLILYLGLRYYRRTPQEVGAPPPAHSKATTVLEITWSIVPLVILLVLFFWGARVFFEMSRPPADAVEFFVVAKQWMWKIQHPDGTREINELHIPIGVPIKLTMTSEDVIHSFFVPAFRTKMDVLPGRYTTVWFQPSKLGSYHLFCAEYCGAEHSKMIGRVVVMEPHAYQAWLAGDRPDRLAPQSGEDLFTAKACDTCHRTDSAARAPILAGLFGKQVAIEGGGSAVVDEAYIRESILDPRAKIASGYQPLMPTYKGQVNEDEILQLINYIKALGTGLSKEGGQR